MQELDAEGERWEDPRDLVNGPTELPHRTPYIPFMPPSVWLVAYEIHYSDGYNTHGVYPTWYANEKKADEFIRDYCVGKWTGDKDGATVIRENFRSIEYAIPPI